MLLKLGVCWFVAILSAALAFGFSVDTSEQPRVIRRFHHLTGL